MRDAGGELREHVLVRCRPGEDPVDEIGLGFRDSCPDFVETTLRDTGRAMSEESTTPDLAERVRVMWQAADSADFDGSCSSSLPIGSRAHVHTRKVFVYEWDDGQIMRVMMYGDIAEGRASAERLAEERG